MNIYAMDFELKRATNSMAVIEGVYLHGDLQDLNGYDIIAVDKETEKEFSSMSDGIYSVTVYIGNAEFEANMYYWHTIYPGTQVRCHRGLIVLINDSPAKTDAINKFIERREFL